MYVELLNALEIKLSWYDTFNLEAQNLKEKTMMLNDIRSRDNNVRKINFVPKSILCKRKKICYKGQFKRDYRSPQSIGNE